MITATDYTQQAIDFLDRTSSTLSIEYDRCGKHFAEDEEDRDIYVCTLKRGNREYTFRFGDSIMNTANHALWKISQKNRGCSFDYIMSHKKDEYEEIGKWYKTIAFGRACVADMEEAYKKAKHTKPSDYSILACLQNYDPGTHEDFCADFGYDVDSIKGLKTYEAVRNEYLNLAKLYSDIELKSLAEIS